MSMLILCNTYCLASCLDIGQLCAWFTLVIYNKALIVSLLLLIGLPAITYWTTVIDLKKIPKGSVRHIAPTPHNQCYWMSTTASLIN